ncbi:YDG/SRA domain-containing protein [Phanerochaete sordida]|uniref:YDG/SRA domain-containing protein n=1 Tax=Phanerochaete sordida TaxID=48140 RepID=A0A9P3GGU9_9APHY|nr:YDG/SRA domain-containing protein [Phanerochaete sordida]
MAREPAPAKQAKPRKKSNIRGEIAGAVFGNIPGVPIGKVFENRKALSASAVHPPLVAGIYGRKQTGARSVVLGGYFDDEDYGDHFTYIGSGGRAPGVRFGPQTEDQSFQNDLNEALRMSALLKKPVRVIRGHKLQSKYAPYAGFRYDGLYTVSRPRIEMGPSGFKLCKFDFERYVGQPPVPVSRRPDSHQSDIEIRNAQYKQILAAATRERAQAAAAGPSSGAGAGHSEDSPIDVDGLLSRGTTESYADEDEDQEDIFGDIDDVENEMAEVAGYLEELKDGTNSKARRKRLLVHVGAHVERVLARKRAELRARARLDGGPDTDTQSNAPTDDADHDDDGAKDEGGRSARWWYDALWSYVGCAMPTDKLVPPATVEGWYRKQAVLVARHDEAREARERAEAGMKVEDEGLRQGRGKKRKARA